MEAARRWSGYVCPDCRFVFRVPRDHDGTGIVCPSCRRMLKVPKATDSPPPLMAPLRKAEAQEPAPEEEQKRVKKRRRGKKHAESPSWERESSVSEGGEKKQMRLMLIGGGALFALMVAGVLIFLNMGDEPPPPPTAQASEPSAAALAKEAAPLKRTRQEILAESEAVAKSFLDAKSIEEMRLWVRPSDTIEERMRRFYPAGQITSEGLSKLELRDDLDAPEEAVFATVRTRNLDDKAIVLVQTADGLRVDWESWVGWSEISWPELAIKKPVTPVEFRVTLTNVDYYNFDFSDDAKWQSFRLESPDLEHGLFGYVEKDSALHDQLRLDADTKKAEMILSIKFPEAATSSNQVLIDRLIGKGWVEGLEAP